MTIEKLNKALQEAEELTRANNREATLDKLAECFDILKGLKPSGAKKEMTEVQALNDIALSLREMVKNR